MRKIKFNKLKKKYVSTKRRKWLRIKNHPFVVPVTTFLVLLVLTGIGFVYFNSQNISPGDSHIVILNYDDKKQTVPTVATTVGDLLTRLNLKLNPGDVVEPDTSTPIVEDEFHVNIYRAQPVTIDDNGHTTFTYSAATTPRSIAAQAGITVYPEDDVTTTIPHNFLETASIGKELIIKRATPVYVNLYGTPIGMRTHVKTVGELIAEKQIEVAKGDSIDPKPSSPIVANMSIIISRKGTKIATVVEQIPAPEQVIQDPNLSFGATAIRQQGTPGKKLVTYQIITRNGKEVSRKKIQEIIAENPVPEIIARGKAIYIPADKSVIMAQAGIASSDYAYVNFIVSHESGWCPTKLQGHPGSCPGFAPADIPNYLGYGLGQATPGNKMSGFGSDWQTNPVTQLKWATSYADGRYGSWAAAYNYWMAHTNW